METKYIVIYDLSSKIGSRKIPQILKRFPNRRIQKSVIEVVVNEVEESKLINKCFRFIDDKIDKLLIIPIGEEQVRRSIHIGLKYISISKTGPFQII